MFNKEILRRKNIEKILKKMLERFEDIFDKTFKKFVQF